MDDRFFFPPKFEEDGVFGAYEVATNGNIFTRHNDKRYFYCDYVEANWCLNIVVTIKIRKNHDNVDDLIKALHKSIDYNKNENNKGFN